MPGEQIGAYIARAGAVFAMGAAPWFEVWTAVPLGVLLGLSPAAALAAAAAGNVFSVAALVAVLPRLRAPITKKFLPDGEAERRGVSGRRKRFQRLWDRYGIPGTTLGAPLLVGTHLATALCLILGAPPRRVLVWITLSIVAWGVVLAALSYLGLEGIRYLSPPNFL